MFARKDIAFGEFILEYRGEIVDKKETERRQSKYQNDNAGSFVYDSVHDKNNKQQNLL